MHIGVVLGTCAGFVPALHGQLFVDVSAAAGFGEYTSAFASLATGAAAADYDGDGFVDVFLPTGEGVPNRVYRNLGNGTFEEVAVVLGLAGTV